MSTSNGKTEPGADGRAACWMLRPGAPKVHDPHFWEMSDMDCKAGMLYYRCPGVKNVVFEIEYWEDE